MLRGFCHVIVVVLGVGLMWGCGGERVMQSQMVRGRGASWMTAE